MENTTKLICETCGKLFSRRTTEVKRNAAKGRKIRCSRQCCGVANQKFLPTTTEHLRSLVHTDDLSPFRHHMKCMKNRYSKKGYRKPVFVTLRDLKEQWDKQKGICPYTGWQLKNASNTGVRLEKTIDRASLDRIDSSKGYTKDNIQFVALAAQYAKNNWNGSDLLMFCKAVVEYNSVI